MSETGTSKSKMPDQSIRHLRALAHDLSNSLETILQASYLLRQTKIDEKTRKWADLIDTGAKDAARLSIQIRDILKAQH